MTTPTRPGWADPIPTRSISGRRAEVSATTTTVVGDPDGPDGPRWIVQATVWGPNGGRRGNVELVLAPQERTLLLAQLLATPGTGPADPVDAATRDLATFRDTAAEVRELVARMADGDVPDAVHDRRDELDRELAALALALLDPEEAS